MTQDPNRSSYLQWLAHQGISEAEHRRQIIEAIHQTPTAHHLHLQILKDRLKAKSAIACWRKSR